MGRINIFIVFIVVIVVGTNFSSLSKSAENISDEMNRYHNEFQMKSMGSFAMNYGIRKLESGDVLLEGEAITWVADDFEVMSSNIDSIQYIPGEGDTVTVIPFVRGSAVNGETINRESEATLAFNIVQPEEQFAYYMFDDGGGGILSDSSGYGYDGALVNMDDTDWLDGVDSYALDFDGDDDFVYLGEEMTQEYDDLLTMAAWIAIDSGNHGEWGAILTESSDFEGNQATGFTLEMKVTFDEGNGNNGNGNGNANNGNGNGNNGNGNGNNGNGNGGNGNHWGWGWGGGNHGNHYGWGNDNSGDEYIDFNFEIETSAGLEDVDLRVYDWEIDLLAWHYIAVVINTEDQTLTLGLDEDIWAEESISGTSLPARDLDSNVTLGSLPDADGDYGNGNNHTSNGHHYGWGWDGNPDGNGNGNHNGINNGNGGNNNGNGNGGNGNGNGNSWGWGWAWGWGHGNCHGHGQCPIAYTGFDGSIDALRFIGDVMSKKELRQLMLYHGVMKPVLRDWKI